MNFNFLKTPKFIFRVFLIIGIGIFISFLLTDNNRYAVNGFFFILLAIPINLFFLIFFLICAFVYKSKYEECIQAIAILLINVPIAFDLISYRI